MRQRSKPFWRIEPRSIVTFFTEEWGLKLMALVLAFLLWTVVQAEEPESAAIDNVRVMVDNRDAGAWHLVGPPQPSTVTAVVTGPSRELLRVAVSSPRIIVPVDDVTDSVLVVPLSRDWIRLANQTDNVLVESLRPSQIELRFEPVLNVLVPVSIQLTGSPVPGFEQEGPVRIEPAVVRVSGPRSRVSSIDTLRLPPLDLSGRSATDTQVVAVEPPAENVIVAPRQVEVIIPIGPIGARPRGGPRQQP